MERPLSITVRQDGKVWWDSPRDKFVEAMVRQAEDPYNPNVVQEMRRTGKTFQMCLAAVRDMLEGKRVLIVTRNRNMVRDAVSRCCEIVEKSFPERMVGSWIKVCLTDSLIQGPSGSIKFAAPSNDRGRLPLLGVTYGKVYMDEMNKTEEIEFMTSNFHGRRWPNPVNSRDLLLKLLKENR